MGEVIIIYKDRNRYSIFLRGARQPYTGIAYGSQAIIKRLEPAVVFHREIVPVD